MDSVSTLPVSTDLAAGKIIAGGNADDQTIYLEQNVCMSRDIL
jgi:hypothetical protein